MKLRNKKTGEICSDIRFEENSIEVYHYDEIDGCQPVGFYNSLAELNEEWEDTPNEEVWYLGKRIGNYTMPKKEADIVTEKILAWKRLKDKGFRFDGYELVDGTIGFMIDLRPLTPDDLYPDLDLLFGGEERVKEI